MSKTSRKKVIAGSAIIALGLMVAGVSAAKAAGPMSGTNPMNSLVDAIATKFKLNPSDVQAVFDEQKTQMDSQYQQMFADRLKQAVADGKLTQDQADKIIAKKAELEALRASFANKTEDEKRAELKTQMDSLKKWATDNNIPAEFMMFGGPSMGPGIMGNKNSGLKGFGHRGMGMMGATKK